MAAFIEHGYGEGVHILGDPYLLTLLSRIGHPDTDMPTVRALLRPVYERLIGAALEHTFPRKRVRVATRMAAICDEGHFEGEVLDSGCRVVIACLVRAGVLPSEICLDVLSKVLDPAGLRIDYLPMSRRVGDDGRVLGTDEAGLKIGGPIRDAILLIPDPMAATGGTVERTLEIYRERGLGPARATIALPMIATPEFMRNRAKGFAELEVYTGRLDRGLSPPEALEMAPGMHEDERGLTDIGYIVPGAGGVGEVLTNSWV